mmetsp:Transcript_101973/g.263561  ORF Transcript_101973/g.263561 Transcript_101973/m.263561 type:complete len:424 (+) Transcript_101973:136-1407(+)
MNWKTRVATSFLSAFLSGCQARRSFLRAFFCCEKGFSRMTAISFATSSSPLQTSRSSSEAPGSSLVGSGFSGASGGGASTGGGGAADGGGSAACPRLSCACSQNFSDSSGSSVVPGIFVAKRSFGRSFFLFGASIAGALRLDGNFRHTDSAAVGCRTRTCLSPMARKPPAAFTMQVSAAFMEAKRTVAISSGPSPASSFTSITGPNLLQACCNATLARDSQSPPFSGTASCRSATSTTASTDASLPFTMPRNFPAAPPARAAAAEAAGAGLASPLDHEGGAVKNGGGPSAPSNRRPPRSFTVHTMSSSSFFRCRTCRRHISGKAASSDGSLPHLMATFRSSRQSFSASCLLRRAGPRILVSSPVARKTVTSEKCWPPSNMALVQAGAVGISAAGGSPSSAARGQHPPWPTAGCADRPSAAPCC